MKLLAVVGTVVSIVVAIACADPHQDSLSISSYQDTTHVPHDAINHVRVVTFNTGLARFGCMESLACLLDHQRSPPNPVDKNVCIDLVPCVRERARAQVEFLFGDHGTFTPHCGTKRRAEYLTLLLQEVWTEEAFLAYQSAAQRWGCAMSPASFHDVVANGQITVTSEAVNATHFVPFAADARGLARGLRFVQFSLNAMPVTIVNVHTTYTAPPEPNPVHVRQLAQIADAMAESSRDRAMVVGGDINSGPDLRHESVASTDLVAALWTPWFQDGLDPRWSRAGAASKEITWDTNNPLVSKPASLVRLWYRAYGSGWGRSSSTLDHLFVSKPFRVTAGSAGAVLATPVPVNGCAEYRNENGAVPLSDHYGWAATLTLLETVHQPFTIVRRRRGLFLARRAIGAWLFQRARRTPGWPLHPALPPREAASLHPVQPLARGSNRFQRRRGSRFPPG